jgi:hypothetical protein
MPSTTPGQSFPVPVGSDDPNVAEDMTTLAVAIERRVVGVYNNATDRDARVSAPQEGQVAFLKDADLFTFFNGTAWTAMFVQPPQFFVHPVAPANNQGNDGDVWFVV